jgi:hypothetical protein
MDWCGHGIKASWHCKRKKVTAKNEAKSEVQPQADVQSQSNPRVCTVLRLQHYGVHKKDTLFAQSLGNFNAIAIDPGHVNLISAVRLHRTETSLKPLQPVEPIGRRKLKLQAAYERQSKSRFELSNREWSPNVDYSTELGLGQETRASRSSGLAS